MTERGYDNPIERLRLIGDDDDAEPAPARLLRIARRASLGPIRLAAREPLEARWDSVGNCGRPPRDQSRSFAYVAITLAVGVWIVLPTLVAIALAA